MAWNWESIAMLLVIIGGINWGLVGLFDFNLVSYVVGAGSIIAKVVYILVGVSAGYLAYMKIKK